VTASGESSGPGPVARAVAAEPDPARRAGIRARALLGALRELGGPPWELEARGVRLRVLGASWEPPALRLVLEAEDAATGEPVPVDNPYLFVNPPVRVGRDGPEDPARALAEIAAAAVLEAAGRG
jgi:hypothetical protein